MFRFEEDTQFLIVYTGSSYATPDDYRRFIERWSERIAQKDRFGVVMVSEPLADQDHQEYNRDHEAAITRLINDFRRTHREQTAECNLGFGRVYAADIIEKYFSEASKWEAGQESLDRYARYNWAIPGRGFAHLSEAKVWLQEQAAKLPTAFTSQHSQNLSSQRIGLFYGSSTGVTEKVAFELQEIWVAQSGVEIPLINIGEVKDLSLLLKYDCLILGTSTWNIGQLQDDWDIAFPKLDALDFSNKQVALFGIGDQYGYPDNFIDAVGILGNKLIERGAEIVGCWDVDGYEVAESIALVNDKFMGLAIDDTRQPELTKPRLQQWIKQIMSEFALQTA